MRMNDLTIFVYKVFLFRPLAVSSNVPARSSALEGVTLASLCVILLSAFNAIVLLYSYIRVIITSAPF